MGLTIPHLKFGSKDNESFDPAKMAPAFAPCRKNSNSILNVLGKSKLSTRVFPSIGKVSGKCIGRFA